MGAFPGWGLPGPSWTCQVQHGLRPTALSRDGNSWGCSAQYRCRKKQRERERHERQRRRMQGVKEGWKERERREGRPVGDPVPQRGKVAACTQTSRPRTQAQVHAHTKNTRTKKGEKNHISMKIKKHKYQHMLVRSTCSFYHSLFLLLLRESRGCEGCKRKEMESVWKHHHGCVMTECIGRVTGMTQVTDWR